MQVFWCLAFNANVIRSQAQGDQQASSQIEKCWPAGLLVSFFTLKMLLANQAQGDQQTSTQIEKCWPVGGLLMLFAKNIENS